MKLNIDDLCRKHDLFLTNHPQRPALLLLLQDNDMASDDAEATADAIIDLLASNDHLKEAV